jgi:hypothetical protein
MSGTQSTGLIDINDETHRILREKKPRTGAGQRNHSGKSWAKPLSGDADIAENVAAKIGHFLPERYATQKKTRV